MNRNLRPRLVAVRHAADARMETNAEEPACSSANMSLMSDDLEEVGREYSEPRCASFTAFAGIRADGKLCDVTIKCGDAIYSAHKIVLCGTIPYFRAMFTGSLIESRLDEVTIGEAEGVNAETLDDLIQFAYTGRVFITNENVQQLMMGAAFLLLDGIVHACGMFLQRRLQTCNVLTMRQFATSVNSASLVHECNRYIHKHFVAITVHSGEFIALPIDDVLDMLNRSQLHVQSEEHVFHAAMRWIGDNEERTQYCALLLRVVRLPLLSPTFLTDNVAADDRLRGCLECRDLIDEAKNYHLLPERRSQMNTFTTTPRSCDDVAGIVYAVGGLTTAGDSQSTVEMYNPITRKWSVIEPMCTLRSRVGVTVKDGLLYAIGGFNGYERLKTVEVFDTIKRQWRQVAPLRNKRSALGACVVDGWVWVCGGYDGITSLSTVEAYDTVTNKWTMQEPMRSQRSAAGIATIDGMIFVIGGHDGTSIFTSVERYNTATREWTTVSPMNSRRCRLGAATLNGKIYACGGYDGASFLSSVEVYDPTTDVWTYLAPMAVKRSRVSLVANCGKLYAIGGFDGNANLASMETYDVDENSWSFGTPMTAHEGGVGIGVIPAMNVLDYE